MHTFNPWLHRFTKLLAAATFVLIFIGGLVTSTGSGLAVPDWPSTYGHFMFSFPFSEMVGGILYEHGHRMVATVVGFLTTVLTIWLWMKEPRRWVRWFGAAALIAVIAQGILGGITVLFLLPTAVSVLHACLAQTFFCMTICLVVFTSKEWLQSEQEPKPLSTPATKNLAVLTTGVVFVQLILGALMRHTGAGLAIPDFPLAFGQIIPPITTQQVAIHFLHRVGALFVTVAVIATAWHIFRNHRAQKKLTRPAILVVAALVLQLTLAALTIWTQKAVIPTTAHVAVAAFILAIALFLALRTHLMTVPQKRSEPAYLVEQPSTS